MEFQPLLNVAHLSPYLEVDHLVNLRASSSQQGEDDRDLPQVPHSGRQDN